MEGKDWGKREREDEVRVREERKGKDRYGLLNIIVEVTIPIIYCHLAGINAFFKQATYDHFILDGFHVYIVICFILSSCI